MKSTEPGSERRWPVGLKVVLPAVAPPMRQADHLVGKRGVLTGYKYVGTQDRQRLETPVFRLEDGTEVTGTECWWQPDHAAELTQDEANILRVAETDSRQEGAAAQAEEGVQVRRNPDILHCRPCLFQRGDTVTTPRGIGKVTAVGLMATARLGQGITVYRVGKNQYWFGWQIKKARKPAPRWRKPGDPALGMS